MIEITNREPGPVQLMVRAADKVSGFTTVAVPGRGRGKNVRVIADEEWTDQIGLLEEKKLIAVRRVSGPGR